MSAPASVSAAALASGIRSAGGLRFRLDPFAFRQFDNAEYSGTRLTGVDKEAFVAAVIDHFAAEPVLVDGYAEFCKHIFMPNFTSATVDAITVPKADFLDIILYSSAQIAKEHEAMPSGDPPPPADSYDWGIISIKGQAVNYEIPMNPITMMRNALGTESGGSGAHASFR
ncbi:flagellar associated protein [Thecamonas trahens ATCC 50062]|uniref:Flagellar associated protein n=1 Tax=Thecamonas trahens ATCC 50062 TaxID=461836 RepID=A0A0L0DNP0_THETB|nr:flagellar associated protein [Thecamonas trahens ATCC 50062]KNC53038.1 flagellar associated protein [Thecamonas trahens ATCC 50062]|eukprot:XP_013754716.1 flagellar associated protein [Thecamonas trahens ATCC 50062]